MDPKQLSEFIARNGKVVRTTPNPRKSMREPVTFTLEFENGATVTYQNPEYDPETGEEMVPFRIVSQDESKPNEAARKQNTSASANESVSAPSNQPYIGSRKPDGTIEWTENPNYRGPATEKPKVLTSQHNKETGVTDVLVENPDGTREWQQITGGPKETPDPAAGMERQALLGSRTEKREGRTVTVETYRLKNGETEEVVKETTEEVMPEPEDTWRDPKTGRLYAIERDKNGIVTRQREITDGGAPSRPMPSTQLDPQASLGSIYSAASRVGERIARDPNMTPPEKLDALQQVKENAELLASETSYILTSQQNTLSNLTSQRNTDIQEAASRRSFSSGLINDAYKNVTSKPGLGRGTAGPAFMAQIELGVRLAEKLGGLDKFERIQPGAAAQQVYNTPLPGSQPQSQPGGGSGGGGGNPINIFNVTQPGATPAPAPVPAAIEQAMPVPPGMRFEGGQLRAPGYQAPEEEAQIPDWMRQYA